LRDGGGSGSRVECELMGVVEVMAGGDKGMVIHPFTSVVERMRTEVGG